MRCENLEIPRPLFRIQIERTVRRFELEAPQKEREGLCVLSTVCLDLPSLDIVPGFQDRRTLSILARLREKAG
jgi:hypothetical protein